MKKILFFIFLVIGTTCPLAADQEFFNYLDSFPVQEGLAAGVYSIQIADELFNLSIGSELKLNISGHPEYTVVHDRKIAHDNGDISWLGYLKDLNRSFRVYLIKGKESIRGQIQTPEGIYKIGSQNGLVLLESMVEKGMIKDPSGPDDYLIPEIPVFESKKKM